MSSLDAVAPMGYYDNLITKYLQGIGYSVTTLRNTQVTVDLLRSGLNEYNVVIWQTDSYSWQHRNYWYVGQVANQAGVSKYASDFADYALDAHAGIIGMNLLFFQQHYSSLSLNNVKLAVLLANGSNSIATAWIQAGAQSVVFCLTSISLQFGEVDDLASQVVAYLAMGYTLSNAVWTTVSPYLSAFPSEDPLDTASSPPFWYLGDGSLTIG